MKILALAGVLLSASCFKTPSYIDGELRCSPDPGNPCPGSGYCVAGYCYHAPDLSVPADAGDPGD